MYSIKKSLENTIIIKKSKFITRLVKVNNIEEINNILEKTKKEYKDSKMASTLVKDLKNLIRLGNL